LSERVRRDVPLRLDPERFHFEKNFIAQDLEHLANELEESQPPSSDHHSSRQRRSVTLQAAAAQRFRAPFFVSAK